MEAIAVQNLTKDYGTLRAVDGISFDINEGEIFGMVGPNGAGKTTTIECIEGLRKPDGGTISVLGLEPYKEREKLYELIGVQLQETSYDPKIKVWEICNLFSSFYSNPLPYSELLDKFELTEKRNSYVSRLSGGQKQKLSIILALVSNPKIVFLDELTTGLDPQARHSMWELIKGLRDEGRTVFLTTHYMEEAEYLCDRVAIMDHGKIVALDTPRNLIESSGIEERIIFEGDVSNIEELKSIKGVLDVLRNQSEIIVYGKGRDFLQNVVSYLQAKGTNYKNLQTKTPNLEDVFLKLTGRKYEGDKA
ncbi:ABC transporter ATP-binding protein [Caldisericum sp. AR60]|uniref:ABC transporter ATP-binding protein n=1 Tax=Caldisericum sp. AR60 TaxID=3397852 RepID=UPI0039FBF305